MSKKQRDAKTQSATPVEMEDGSDAQPVNESNRTSSPGPHNLPSKQSQLGRYVSFGLLLAVIALVGFVFYEVMVSFLIPLFLAALLVVVFRPLHRWISDKCGGRQQLSAGLTTAAVSLTVLVPLVSLLLLALVEGREVVRQFNASKVEEGIRKLRSSLNLDLPAANQIRQIEAKLSGLQLTESLNDLEVDRHRSSLYSIEQSAKSLAVAAELVWPEEAKGLPEESENFNADVESPPVYSATEPDPDDYWHQFCASLKATRELHFKSTLSRTRDETEEVSRQRMEQIRHYRELINETADHFSKFKAQLLGGKTRAWLAELVNPSDEEFEMYTSTSVRYLRDKLFKLGGDAASFLGNTLLGFAIMIIGLYFFLKDGPGMIVTFQGLSPLDDAHEQELVTEFGKVSRAVVVATLLSALVQGILAGFGFYFAGLESIFLLTVLSAVLAMVPFVGAAAVWIPCSLYLSFFENELAAAIGLALYGVLVISMADNVIKPFVLHGQSNLHPLLALLSVLGGVATLGPIGILIGPMVVAFLQTLLKILQREISVIESEGGQRKQIV